MIKVYIAEDDFRVANIHEQFLQKIPEVQLLGKAGNCKETLKAVKKHKIDLVILDNYMPDGHGIDLIDDIYSLSPQTDIILVSAENDKAYVETAIRKGVKGIIIKPATLERFVSTIIKYMENKKNLQHANQIDQDFLDDFFGVGRIQKPAVVAKGIDPLTLQKVRDVLMDHSSGITAEKMGEQMGASRTTARRYLEHLVAIDECFAELAYGIVGRPERHYYMKKD
ncbi:Response regulator [Planococcus antarcticus DSM 14505]|uniref:Transcriptional regulatory protein n=1 Tax=Planococcus antarcticus DSM 14505 TaxID=1185653 RepID=A0A1C7DEG5_9BACL|nr:response regulator [Planococcus antarcticus]ANU09802.1 response regulator [Planococcus antarcticus DSM 14505]EIM07599.1 Response regulator [Planococcus antarcticus DSM 14505]